VDRRALGKAFLGPVFDVLLLLRPRQWPILSFQLAVGVLLAPLTVVALCGAAGLPRPTLPTVDSAGGPVGSVLLLAWLAWVVGLNGGTLAFNSAYDRDVEDIAYLRRPPAPPRGLALYGLLLMAAGGLLAFSLSPGLGILTTVCILLSVLYSHPRTRWKRRPGLDLATNMLGYGAGTTLAGLLAAAAAFEDPAADRGAWQAMESWPTESWLLVAGFGLLFGSFYPLSQVYQVEPDCRRGDRTLVSALGVGPSLRLALALGLLGGLCLLAAVAAWPSPPPGPAVARAACLALRWGPPSLSLLAWLAHLWRWHGRYRSMEQREHERAMYHALLLWAVVDGALLLGRYAPSLFC
jgi:4-hydroxybenzoate polyprenyltransferase